MSAGENNRFINQFNFKLHIQLTLYLLKWYFMNLFRGSFNWRVRILRIHFRTRKLGTMLQLAIDTLPETGNWQQILSSGLILDVAKTSPELQVCDNKSRGQSLSWSYVKTICYKINPQLTFFCKNWHWKNWMHDEFIRVTVTVIPTMKSALDNFLKRVSGQPIWL